uniref:Uncharacterized protein n=1 Tax=Anguilla anguilla TaxID=7936 RepID=A0A0E9XQ53_ANGAN
MNIPYICNIF